MSDFRINRVRHKTADILVRERTLKEREQRKKRGLPPLKGSGIWFNSQQSLEKFT